MKDVARTLIFNPACSCTQVCIARVWGPPWSASGQFVLAACCSLQRCSLTSFCGCRSACKRSAPLANHILNSWWTVMFLRVHCCAAVQAHWNGTDSAWNGVFRFLLQDAEAYNVLWHWHHVRMRPIQDQNCKAVLRSTLVVLRTFVRKPLQCALGRSEELNQLWSVTTPVWGQKSPFLCWTHRLLNEDL